MLKELLISIVSGVIVAILLQIFRIGGSTSPSNAPRQTMYGSAPPARRSGGGGFFRFVLAVIGGLVLAVATMPFVLEALHGGRGGGYGRGRSFDSGYYDRGGDGIFGLPPLLVLTIIGTIIVWVLLSALRRR
jgi:hypothetical protein